MAMVFKSMMSEAKKCRGTNCYFLGASKISCFSHSTPPYTNLYSTTLLHNSMETAEIYERMSDSIYFSYDKLAWSPPYIYI